jgi:enolase-phosphatase E1
LLFSTVASGDLTPHIAGFFDTRTGAKADSNSYAKIAAAIGHKPGEILFISDAVKEVDAAQKAGMPAILCVRDALASGTSSHYHVIHNFDEIFPG